MSLLNRTVGEIRSEEVVLGIGFNRWDGNADQNVKAGSKTELEVVSGGKKGWVGYSSVVHALQDAAIGEALKESPFPAKCELTFRRAKETVKTDFGQREMEKLVIVACRYICPVDVVEVKGADSKKAA